MSTVAEKVPFHELTGLLEGIGRKHGTDEKKKFLKKFIDQWRDFHTKIHKDDVATTDSFYPAMRLLLPQLERERDAYGIKEHTLAKLYIEILGLGKDSPSAQKLINYRAPKNAKADAGDFATVAYFVLKPRLSERGTMTIAEVNHCLDEVALSHANKSKDGVRRHLLKMLKNMSAMEQKWLIRMIMKELKVGLSQQSVFSVFHQDAEDVFNVKMSLEKVCTMLRDPTVRMHEIEVSLFSPFRPMLGDRGTPSKMEKLLDGKPFYIETKFDGERMQLHKSGDEYKYFSRSGNDYTYAYGQDEGDGTFTPFISGCFKANVTSCILDGEMVGYNPTTKVIGSKGENFDIKATVIKDYQPMLCVFDILMLNGKVLSNKTLQERKEVLNDVFNPVEGRIKLSEYRLGHSNQDCLDALNSAIDDREEGIMIKDLSTPYKPNTRKGGWYKLKPEYVGGLMDELDVLIVGGNYGAGARGGVHPSHFLCAVAVPAAEGEKPTKFHSFCRVGSGYSRKELYDLNQRLAAHWNQYNRKRPPTFLELAAGQRQRPDLWIEPENSCILQIKAAEIIDSAQFCTGYTLRFPRVEKIRTDKAWYECMTTKEMDDLRQKSEGKLAGAYAGLDDDDEPKKKKRKMTTHHVKPTVGARWRAADVSAVTKVSELFAGKEICVMNGPSSHPKAELEKIIVEHGGSVVQHPSGETLCVLAEKVAIKVRNLINKGIYNVVKVEWLLRCVEEKRFIPWIPSDMMHTAPATLKAFAEDYDRHGDSYYTDTTVEELKKVFDKIEEQGSAKPVTMEDIAEMEEKYFPQDSLLGLFRTCRIYLDKNLVLGDTSTYIKNSPLELVAMDLRYHGATLSDSLDGEVTHVIVDENDTSRVSSLREVNRRRAKKSHIVTQDWVMHCLERETLISERQYEPKAS